MAQHLLDAQGNKVKHNGEEVFTSIARDCVKTVDMGKRRLVMTGSDETRDRDGDILLVNGWELENYLKNPVVLWGHDRHALPIAASEKVIKRRNPPRLDFVWKFPTEGLHPFADVVLGLYNEKILNASSVSFKSKKWEDLEPDPHETGNPIFGHMRGRKFTKQELREISGVTIPANPNALQRSLQSAGQIKAISKAFKGDLNVLIEYLVGQKAFEVSESTSEAVLEHMACVGGQCRYEEETSTSVQVPDDLDGGADCGDDKAEQAGAGEDSKEQKRISELKAELETTKSDVAILIEKLSTQPSNEKIARYLTAVDDKKRSELISRFITKELTTSWLIARKDSAEVQDILSNVLSQRGLPLYEEVLSRTVGNEQPQQQQQPAGETQQRQDDPAKDDKPKYDPAKLQALAESVRKLSAAIKQLQEG